MKKPIALAVVLVLGILFAGVDADADVAFGRVSLTFKGFQGRWDTVTKDLSVEVKSFRKDARPVIRADAGSDGIYVIEAAQSPEMFEIKKVYYRGKSIPSAGGRAIVRSGWGHFPEYRYFVDPSGRISVDILFRDKTVQFRSDGKKYSRKNVPADNYTGDLEVAAKNRKLQAVREKIGISIARKRIDQRIGQAKQAIKEGEHDRALEIFAALKQEFPGLSEELKREEARAYQELAKEAIRSGSADTEKTVEYIRKAAERDLKSFVFSGHTFGDFLRENGREDLALTLARQLYESEVAKGGKLGHWDYESYMKALKLQGRADEVDRIYRQMIERDNELLPAYVDELVDSHAPFEKTFPYIRKMLEEDPTDFSYSGNDVGRYLRANGKTSLAEKYAKANYEKYKDKKRYWAYMPLVYQYRATGQYAELDKFYKELLRTNPGDGGVVVSYADSMCNRDDLSRAAAALEGALPSIKGSNDRKKVLKKLADIYADQKDLKKAKKAVDDYYGEDSEDKWVVSTTGKFYRDRLNRPREALAYFSRLMEKEQKWSTGYVEALATYITLGDHPAAEQTALRYYELFPEKKGRIRREYLTLARAYLFAGNPEKGLEIVDALLAEDPDAAYLRYDRARALCLMGRKDESLNELKRSMSHYHAILARADACFKPLWENARFREVTDLARTNQRILEEKMEKMEAEPDKLVNVLRVLQQYRRLGKYEKSLALAGQVIAKIDTYQDRDKMECWIYDEIGRVYDRIGDRDNLNDVYREGIRKVGLDNSRVVNILINHGDRLISHGRYAEALENVEKAGRVGVSSYGNMQVQEVKCLAYHGLGKEDLHRIVLGIMESDHSADPLSLAGVYLDLGKENEAARIYAAALLNPKYRDRALAGLQLYTWKMKKNAPLRPSESGNALRNHPDVLAALETVGRINRVEAYGRY